MSKYTTEVRYICETYAGLKESVGGSKVDEIIELAIPKVFDFEFPMFDEKYRKVLCKKILKHYYTREISEETVGLWKLRLNTRLNEIMPYYNQLYESALLEFNPLYDVEMVTTNKGTQTQKNEGNFKGVGSSSGVNTRREMYSDTPQGSLQNVESGEYLTNAKKTSDNTSDTTNSESNTTSNANTIEDYITSVKGKTAGQSYSKLLKEFRSTFLNIDVEVINEISDLFFGLW